MARFAPRSEVPQKRVRYAESTEFRPPRAHDRGTPHRCGSATDRAVRTRESQTKELAAASASPFSPDREQHLWQPAHRRQGDGAKETVGKETGWSALHATSRFTAVTVNGAFLRPQRRLYFAIHDRLRRADHALPAPADWRAMQSIRATGLSIPSDDRSRHPRPRRSTRSGGSIYRRFY